MSNSFSPRFVRARVSFNYEGANHQTGECLINSSGLPGMAWKAFDPYPHLGKRVMAAVHVLSATPWEFTCDALINCEQSAGGMASSLGLTFLFKPGDRAKLDVCLAQEGVLPEYIRKFPRIHFMESVPVFPSRAIVKYFYKSEEVAVSCDVENVSPTGLSVITDDCRTEALLPNETVRVQIQPRGPWLRPIAANAQVKRVIHAVEPTTGNVRRHFGLAITTISGEAKVAFTDLLRSIVVAAKNRD